jgi:glycosyltransferase involved in cell wall biosynthesis
MSADLRLLTFTSLYPSATRPRHGIFVESRLQRLIGRGGIQARVIAPVPWFPFAGKRWGEYGRIAGTPGSELRGGIEVRHPRYFQIPRFGMALQPGAMARCGRRAAQAWQREGATFDLVDAHYLYPDGVAAAAVARALGLPYVLTARGSDVNVIAHLPGPRERIVAAIAGSSGVIAVSAALKAAMVGLGVAAERVTVLRNGVDTELFRPEDRAAARRELNLPAGPPIVASVGNLVSGKRHDLVLEAAVMLAPAHVVIVGRGAQRRVLERQAVQLGMQDRVHFLEEMPQSRLRLVYSAVDVLVLASEREGWPNVLLESAACGTPVVAFSVGGVPEILADPAVGTIVRERHAPQPLADAVRALIMNRPSPDAVRAAAVRFSWEPVLEAQLALYRRAVRAARPPRPASAQEAVSA